MSIALIIPALIALVGLLIYVLAAKAEAKEIGRLMFGCGLLVTLFAVAHNVVKLL
jgi:Na+/phosphate symporter